MVLANAWIVGVMNDYYDHIIAIHPREYLRPNAIYVAWGHRVIAYSCLAACAAALVLNRFALRVMVTLVSVFASWELIGWPFELWGYYNSTEFEQTLARPEDIHWAPFLWHLSSGPRMIAWLLLNHFLIVKPILRGARADRAAA